MYLIICGRVPVNTRSSDGWFWIRDFRGACTGRFWRIPVAPKVLVCLWRAIRDSVWRLMGKGGNRISFISFQNWFQVRCQNDTLLELRTVALTCWAIWKARNIVIWDNKTLHPGELKNMMLSMEAQWSNKTVAERECTPQRHEVSLRAEAYKCFFDAATSISEESISFDCVLFYPGGAFVAAANGGKLGPLDPLLAEALACTETLSWFRNRGIRDVEILSDCEVLVGAIKKGRAFECYSYLGPILDDCVELLSSFTSIGFHFIRMNHNCIAHTLARCATPHFVSWSCTPPSCITHLISSE
ncbi:hypothetical protein DM860_016362 [Cuscuta australis]|uniref:RNase H type-1 domain-containing protein n=1 Tax=Cuscuta australis TaxID=267555 RepID=A0A328D865_9ASTE|nr:hypothetical protein DM860_016362 [Cuscuta australis]